MFERYPIPTPFQVGPINAYLAGRTLVDPGPDGEEAWTELLTALEENDLSPDDVEQVLVTHPHPDHFGSAHRFAERGATVYASDPCAEIVGDFAGRWAYEREFFTDFFERNGMSAATADTVTELPEAFLNYAPDVDVDVSLAAGDTVTVAGTELAVDEVTGHALGELTFTYEDDDGDSVCIVGDNVLPDITPNPFLQPPTEPGGERPRVLPRYNDCLERQHDAGYDRLLPGHRDVITDPSGRIREILDAHEQRTDDVRELLDGPMTAVDVMAGLFEDLPVTEQFSGMSEAIGHLDVLEERGVVERTERGGMIVYERA
ncbi:MBL fold metallo-hydrolase [Haloarchaeobius salinus]|uniref:MBL fold metallo-hydrolase n=1 Tax=Haloarchaeobius salinus TaxID=1198298 RepID=UPI00210D7385|nr:MBL fold metallo-hydrolase [Haloarchaeobius salinus]